MSEPDSVRVALLQINPTVGDLDGNARLVADAARAAWQQGARVALAPELGLCGYPPEDLLLRPAFLHANTAALEALARALADCDGLHLVVGHPWDGGAGRQAQGDHEDDLRSKSVSVPRVFNAASVLAGGLVAATYCKRELPNYQVFDERRYFVSGRDAGLGPVVFEAEGVRFGVLICEDAW
ncbi:MAG TPA: nitrilase-related carbon-nitrogen hydrolase, partial [Solirubrobacteraceae bacterium]